MIELSLSIICVCFPAVKLFIDKYFGTGLGAPNVISPIESFQISGSNASNGSRGSRLKSRIKMVQSEFSSLCGRSQESTARSFFDEERPPTRGLEPVPELNSNTVMSPKNGIPPFCFPVETVEMEAGFSLGLIED